ncbi:response regulator transcription factor [Heliorestis acidaminivorans]|uniref:Stage 0 sporulation protein A homolog n=1 Tax=Heliorestis acidaminivorans TaxID=553427 RepID=A0A6I0EQT2_9FIRM|nr:LytTR family DNA-binding domain-containing protein [Heliorestis acidaminivorans]KAB2952576.1 response regulator transcription factor [Heliorestis acidaminivorans]
MRLRTLIVDQEHLARQKLRQHLEKHDFIQLVGEATSMQEAIDLLEHVDYALIFSEVDLPGGSGLDLCAQLKQSLNPPLVILVTSSEQYALKAYEVDAIDYLLKPLAEERVNESLRKAQRFAKPKRKLKEPTLGKESFCLGIIPVERSGKTILLQEKDIIYAFTDNDAVYIKTTGERFITKYTLKELESRLRGPKFFRSHRCYLVNLEKTREVVPFFNGTFNLIVDDSEKSEVPVSRSQSKKLRELLGL